VANLSARSWAVFQVVSILASSIPLNRALRSQVIPAAVAGAVVLMMFILIPILEVIPLARVDSRVVGRIGEFLGHWRVRMIRFLLQRGGGRWLEVDFLD